MEQIGQTLQKLKTSTTEKSLAPLSSAAVGTLFAELANMLGAAALGRMLAAGRDMHIDLNAKPGDAPEWVQDVHRTWAEHLAGFTKRELQRGLSAVSEAKFPPTLPEFKRHCRPCLDPEVAWWEAEYAMRQRARGEVGDWTHPAVWRAATQMSSELRTNDYVKHRVRWSVLLKRELTKGIGDGIPGPSKRVGNSPDPVRAPTKAEKAEHAAILAAAREAKKPKTEEPTA